jgi:hypothetical protein
MVDRLPQEQGAGAGEDETLRRLFAQALPDEPLPPAALARLSAQVLDEVRVHMLTPQAAQAPGRAPAASATTAPATAAPKGWAAVERMRAWMRSLTARQSLLLAGGGALAVLLIFVGISRITPRPLSVTAAVSGGDATVLSWHSDQFRTEGDGDLIKLREGDQVLTGTGTVRLSHFPDQETVIEPGAHVELTRLDEADGGRQLALTVHDGSVHSAIAARLGAADQYIIHTPGVTVTARGTDFTVETVSEEETLVTAFSGRVEVEMGGQRVTIGAGQEVDAVMGEALEVQPADGKYDGGLKPRLLTLDGDEGVQLYALPRTDAAPLGRLPAGRAVTIQAEDPRGWVKICCVAGKAAWVKIR